MAKDVIMPVLGMNQDTALLVSWLAKEGDTVNEGDPIMEVETDKAVMQLDAPASGVLVDVTAEEGDDVTVGSVIARIVAEGEAPPPPRKDAGSKDAGSKDAGSEHAASPTSEPPAPPSAPPTAPSSASPTPPPAQASDRSASAETPARDPDAPRTPASPLARRTAEERGFDLGSLPGSGPHGAVLMRDVPEAASAAAAQAAPAAVTQAAGALGAGAALAELERRIDASTLVGLLAAAGDVPLAAAMARFLAAVVARRLPEDLTGGVTLDVRGPGGIAHLAHAERRSMLDLARLLDEAGAEPGDAGPPTAVLVHAGDAPLDAVRPQSDAPVSLGMARPGGGDAIVLTLRYRPDRVDDALAMTMLADLARLVDEPHVLAVAF